MEINHKKIDDLNGVINITVQKNDYQESVLKILKDYRKKANIPGFRKGHVPLGLIKKNALLKQYIFVYAFCCSVATQSLRMLIWSCCSIRQPLLNLPCTCFQQPSWKGTSVQWCFLN